MKGLHPSLLDCSAGLINDTLARPLECLPLLLTPESIKYQKNWACHRRREWEAAYQSVLSLGNHLDGQRQAHFITLGVESSSSFLLSWHSLPITLYSLNKGEEGGAQEQSPLRKMSAPLSHALSFSLSLSPFTAEAAHQLSWTWLPLFLNALVHFGMVIGGWEDKPTVMQDPRSRF